MNEDHVIRKIRKGDPEIIRQAFEDQGWNKPIGLYKHYIDLQRKGERDILILDYKGEFAGYLTIEWESGYPPFKEKGIPEIVDFNVLKKFQRKGLGTKLMDEAEKRMKKVSYLAGIGVGLLQDYGHAQRLYVNRGYVPDGLGITFNGSPVKYEDQVIAGDDLVLHFTKQL